jgi:hypothetical protein
MEIWLTEERWGTLPCISNSHNFKGISGNAYAFMRLYNVKKEIKYF